MYMCLLLDAVVQTLSDQSLSWSSITLRSGAGRLQLARVLQQKHCEQQQQKASNKQGMRSSCRPTDVLIETSRLNDDATCAAARAGQMFRVWAHASCEVQCMDN